MIFKHQLMSIALLFFISISNSALWAKGPSLSDNDVDFLEQIQKRYYLIQRLKSPFAHIIKKCGSIPHGCMANTLLSYEHLVNAEPIKNFKHDAIRASIARFSKTHDRHEIAHLWLECLSYRHLDSEDFVKELIIALLEIYKIVAGDTNKNVISLPLSSAMPIEDLLSTLDLCIEAPNSKVQPAHGNINSGGVNFVVANAQRFYIIQRLFPIISLLDKFKSLQFQELGGSFKNPAISAMIESCKIKHSAEPIKHLWHELLAYKYINNDDVIREYTMVLCQIYWQWHRHLSVIYKNNQSLAQDVYTLYGKVSELPIPELLNLLDQISDQVADIIDTYEFNDDLTWTEWITQYWWVPPTIVASLIIKIVLTKFGY